MRSRPAVLLTPSIAGRLSRPSCAVEHTFCATNVPRGAEKSPKRSLFDGWPGRPFPYLVTSLLPFSLFLKSFSRNTYGSPRKCCKQKTYGLAKPFRCKTNKKHRGWGGRGPLLTIPKLATRHFTQVLSFHIFAHSFARFCTRQKINSFVLNRFRTLCGKKPGVGYPSSPNRPRPRKYPVGICLVLTS